MKDLLRNSVVEVTFKKKDGSTRVMICTLMSDFLPEVQGTGLSSPTGVTTVYDLESEGWRAFRDDSVISYKELEV